MRPVGTANVRRGTGVAGYAVVLLLLAPFLVETVATSNTPAVRFPLLLPVFAVAYGCPALLLRELWVRERLTWGRALLAGLGYTAFNEGVVAATWFKLAPGTGRVLAFTAGQAGHAAGVNWSVAAGLVVFHTLYSLMLPITVVHALAAARGSDAQRRPWLGRGGVVACLVLVGALLLVSLTPKGTARVCAGPAVSGCSTGRPLAAVLFVLVAVTLVALPAPRRTRAGRTSRHLPAAAALGVGAGFGLAFTTAFFVLPLLDRPAAAIALDAVLFGIVGLMASRWCRPGRSAVRSDLLVSLGLLLPGMVASVAAWRAGQPVAVVLALLLYGYLLRRSGRIDDSGGGTPTPR